MVRETHRSDGAERAQDKKPAPRANSAATHVAQTAIVSAFGLARHGGPKTARRAARPINLERRAHFAGVETG